MFRGTIKERMQSNATNEENQKSFFVGVAKLLLWTGALTFSTMHVIIMETEFFFANLPFMVLMFLLSMITFCAFGVEEIETKIALKRESIFNEEEINKVKRFKKGVSRLMIMAKFVMPLSILVFGTVTNQAFYEYEIAGYTVNQWTFTTFLLASLALFVQCLLMNSALKEGKEDSELPKVLYVDNLRKETIKINRMIEHRNEFFPEADFAEMRREIESLNELLAVYKNADELVRFETKTVTMGAIDAVYNKLMQNTEASEEIELIERKAKRIVG